MIQKFVSLLTVLFGIYCLVAGAWVFCNPQDAASRGYDASVGLKALALGLVLVSIGAVAIAGERRSEKLRNLQ